jgi:hypothetical protein
MGDLRFDIAFHDPRPWRVVWRASLVADDGETYLRPVLDHAHIVRVARGGILIEGTEVVPSRSTGIKNVKTARYPQVWWCVPQLQPIRGPS